MNKPLSEWTLGEIKAECKRCNGNCINAVCPMVKWISKDEMACVIIRELRKPTPASWDFSEPPRWTEQDKADAKALKRMIKNAHHVLRCAEEVSLRLYDEYDNYILTLSNCFAALPPQTGVALNEIIGGGE